MQLTVIPGHVEDVNPESRAAHFWLPGSPAQGRPGMTNQTKSPVFSTGLLIVWI
jgi:hypothetical protein